MTHEDSEIDNIVNNISPLLLLDVEFMTELKQMFE